MASERETIIELKNFEKKFDSRVIHRGVNLSVKEGECVGLIGGSGSGKSVILRSLIGLEKATGGEVLIHGRDITPLSEEELIEVRKKVAYIFQGGALFDSMNVEANLAYPLREHTEMTTTEISERIGRVLHELGLDGTEKIMPANLSGGMQKRVGLARAIIMRPEVVLYDEPTAGLDPYNTKRIQEIILALKKQRGVTSILVTHDMPTAFAVCDRLALLLDGKIVEEGTCEELHEKSSIMHKFISGERT